MNRYQQTDNNIKHYEREISLESLEIVTSRSNKSNWTHQHICVLKVVPPVRTDVALTSNVPNIQLEASGLNTLYIEALLEMNVDALSLTRSMSTKAGYVRACDFILELG